ncbi:asparagine synthase (glutamine-hydrolyzing) [uncultured Lamprocystis sp.]|jgi:asparagine synthase (glutamine-hydrolysing)|uniref:asparagine synthase (glutamine-hydrolyzing) n=1 Tax=uncultured Lamprocystis sp. TaxID=543132 RepID=UPI0025E3C4BD|nr:asparagine synthase (glutamine-hydrolyzing) [uncultured Lamprocystis sp.]
MCGLIGIASTRCIGDRAWLAAGRDTMLHRGPDDAGEWWSQDGRVGLAHRRLSILDLSPLGHQPMHDDARGLSISYNGEIYNHEDLRKELSALGFAFRSHSDTEVLLAAYAAWGMECLKRLNGMFAFALYDARQQKLYLARDRAGEKPLFYRLADGTLQFASELKALLANPAMPRRIDPDALDCYLALGYVPGRNCILQTYNKLPPAHALCFDLQGGAIAVSRYWSLPELSTHSMSPSLDETALLDELEQLLESAVEQQMMGDVPVGVLLSGGVDSSLVTAMAVRRSQKVRTFSIGFPGHGSMDETPHARLIAHHFGTEHTELMAEPTTADILPSLAKQFDEPMVDSSMIPTWLVSHLVRRHCKVALGGDGGDELFGGYPYYSRLLWLRRRLAHVPTSLCSAVSLLADRWLPVGMKGRNYLQGLGTDLREGLPLQINGVFDRKTRHKLMRNHPNPSAFAEGMHFALTPVSRDVLQRATRMDFNNYLAEDLLVKVDRSSMLNSLEIRAPLLDYRLIEFAFAKVPSTLKATDRHKKILLKRLADRVLPAGFDRHRKQGFSIPLAEWLRKGPFRELFFDTLTSTDCLFDRSAVNYLFRLQDRGFNNGERLFALVQIELWRKHYGTHL